MNEFTHNDQPILKPEEDRFGVNSFAVALANSILGIKSPKGTVIGLNGPWGSGKSSALNLIRYHLGDAAKKGDIVLIDFACWWFRGEEALALAFFRELYAGLSPSLGEKLKKSLPKLGARLLKTGGILGGAADLAGAGGIGGVAGNAMEWIGGLIQQEESVEQLHADLSRLLSEQKRRFLIVIDDIDRLSPDEALLIFRLVKSVGRLPNVMYLLVYDRQLAERIVSERYPSEGPHYLEKIVQAAFELPEPMASDINRNLLEQISAICGDIPQEKIVRFMNIFYEGVAPEMRTPRDVARFINSLAVTWPAVAGEVDPADFVALEVFRLLHPEIYRAIRQNKNDLCDLIDPDRHADKSQMAKDCDDLFLRLSVGARRERHKKTLMRIFPLLEGVWGNVSYSRDFIQQWSGERRVCSSVHFDGYFRFAIGPDVLSSSELEALIANAGNPEFIAATLQNAITVKRSTGGTKAAVILEELNVHADRIEHEKIQPLLIALFQIADEINVEEDKGGPFTSATNELRLHWLLRRLTKDRMSLEERSSVFLTACKLASLGWLADFATSAWTDYHPRGGREPEPEAKCLTTIDVAQVLQDMLRDRLFEASASGELLKNSELSYLLYRWNALNNDNGAAVREWTTQQLASDEGLRRFVIAFTGYGWTQGIGGFGQLGDLVARRTTKARVDGLNQLVDVSLFRQRVEEVAASGQSPEVTDFLNIWRRQESGSED